MTTVTIDDALAMRLRDLRGGENDFNRMVTEALAETAQRWEWEAAGRAAGYAGRAVPYACRG